MTALFHKCGHAGVLHAHSDPAIGGMVKPKTDRPLTIDMHCHIVTVAVEKLVADTPQKKGEVNFLMGMQGEASTRHNQQLFNSSEMRAKLSDIDTRLNEMEKMGVDIQVISASPSQYYYWADRDLAAEIVRLQNERIAEVCAQYPQHFLGLGAIAPQHPDLVVTQLEAAMEKYGCKGVIISTFINGVDLSDTRYERFWAKAEELNAIVFIHPLGTSLGERVNTHYLTNIIGQPLETTITLSKLIFDGVLDRYPALKVLAAHGGGYLPGYIGRTDHGHAVRPEAQGIQHKPSDYLRRIYFDNLVYTPLGVKHLIEQVGVSQVVVGTDYPFDMGMYNIHEVVNAVENLSEAERTQILSGNAARLLGINTFSNRS
jgi:aminocarboxymuconate-semialdehyde decarboxylase